jgi:hypothetical protein
MNLLSGETTVERMGKRPRRNRNSLIETPKKKFSIE